MVVFFSCPTWKPTKLNYALAYDFLLILHYAFPPLNIVENVIAAPLNLQKPYMTFKHYCGITLDLFLFIVRFHLRNHHISILTLNYALFEEERQA